MSTAGTFAEPAAVRRAALGPCTCDGRTCAHPDHRRVLLRAVARRRVARRVVAMLAWIDTHAAPGVTRQTHPALARLDDLVGEAGRLAEAL